MKIICSPQGIIDSKRPRNGMVDIEKAGFTEILFDTNIGKEGISPDVLRDAVKARALCASVAKVLPETDLNSSYVNSAAYIIPPLTEIEIRENIWSENKKYYLQRLEEIKALNSENTGVKILLQNQCREVNGHMIRSVYSDARVLADWIDELNVIAGQDIFGMCVDTGALNLCGQNPYEYIHTLGKRVKAVILRENDGQHDYAMLPFTSVANKSSQMDWLGVIRGLREIEFDGYLIMDFGNAASAFSPLLRPQFISMAKSIAEYFKWQIEIETLLKKYSSRVLFGAGNMCRNYMKNYGKKYPPLFTCDNNKNLWGTEFCGLEVKSPECLKELPEGCAIYICNVYYREIEQQLREMGIENPIEYFNDEYMPTFHFDRVER